MIMPESRELDYKKLTYTGEIAIPRWPLSGVPLYPVRVKFRTALLIDKRYIFNQNMQIEKIIQLH